MKNSTLNRSMLSDENMALLAELKSQNENFSENNNSENVENRTKQDELDILWQNFKISPKEEKSPGIYLLAGFIAGALSMFLMTAMLSITTFADTNNGMAQNERKIVKKAHGSFTSSVAATESADVVEPSKDKDLMAEEIINKTPAVINDKYRVKAGDSLEAISVKFYGKTSPENTAKLQKANDLASPHAIYAGQELLIPMN